jgi:hypothetical protein
MNPAWLVLLENDVPVGVVHPSRREQAINWKTRKEGREIREVPECT